LTLEAKAMLKSGLASPIRQEAEPAGGRLVPDDVVDRDLQRQGGEQGQRRRDQAE
jgi:hypothetical protein